MPKIGSFNPVKWGPRKPKERMKVVECGTGRWDDHGLDYPHEMVTTNFKITGDGHRRIESIYTDCCHDRAARELLDEKQPDHRIGAWLSRHACSFVLFDTQPRRTVIGFERPDDAEAFKVEFC
jgi:hypothetical protein